MKNPKTGPRRTTLSGKAAKKDEPDFPDMSIWHWKDARIQPMQQVQETRDKNFSYLSLYRVAEQKFIRLADPSLREVRLLPEYVASVGLDKTAYELDESLDGNGFTDVYTLDLKTGAREKGLSKVRWLMGSSPDGSHLLYFDDGNFYHVRGGDEEVLQHYREGGHKLCGYGRRP